MLAQCSSAESKSAFAPDCPTGLGELALLKASLFIHIWDKEGIECLGCFCVLCHLLPCLIQQGGCSFPSSPFAAGVLVEASCCPSCPSPDWLLEATPYGTSPLLSAGTVLLLCILLCKVLWSLAVLWELCSRPSSTGLSLVLAKRVLEPP